MRKNISGLYATCKFLLKTKIKKMKSSVHKIWTIVCTYLLFIIGDKNITKTHVVQLEILQLFNFVYSNETVVNLTQTYEENRNLFKESYLLWIAFKLWNTCNRKTIYSLNI